MRFLAAVIFAASALASKPPPYEPQCRLMSRIVSGSNAWNWTKERGIEFARQVALGTPDPLPLTHFNLEAVEVRECALRAIGEAGGRNAITFLSSLTRSSFGNLPDDSRRLWIASQLALHDAKLSALASPSERREFLAAVLQKRHEPVLAGSVISWAVNELCDAGETMALPLIVQSIRRRQGREADASIQYCEARLRIVVSHPDRLAALSSALLDKQRPPDTRITMWLINKLNAMQSPAADAIRLMQSKRDPR